MRIKMSDLIYLYKCNLCEVYHASNDEGTPAYYLSPRGWRLGAYFDRLDSQYQLLKDLRDDDKTPPNW